MFYSLTFYPVLHFQQTYFSYLPGEYDVQVANAEITSNLKMQSNPVDKGKQKMSQLSNEIQFVTEKPGFILVNFFSADEPCDRCR